MLRQQMRRQGYWLLRTVVDVCSAALRLRAQLKPSRTNSVWRVAILAAERHTLLD